MIRPAGLLPLSATVVLVACLVAGCGGGSSSLSAGGPSGSPSSSAPANVWVSSSIRSGARLMRPVVWRAKVSPGAVVDHVDFLVDGHRRWTEQEEPYEFDEGLAFAPWALGAGRHQLAIRVVTTSGDTASTDADVTVATDRSAALPVGDYSRTMTRADLNRVLPYRDAAHGAFGETSTPGRWVMTVRQNGVLVLDIAKDDGLDGFYLPYRASGDRVTVYGAEPWLQPHHPDQPSLFCRPEPTASYRWSTSADGTLTITSTGPSCADRDAPLVGAWERS